MPAAQAQTTSSQNNESAAEVTVSPTPIPTDESSNSALAADDASPAPPATVFNSSSPSSTTASAIVAPAVAPPAVASPAVLPLKRNGTIEFGAESSRLSDGFPNWSGFYTRANWQPNARNNLNLEVARQNHFDEQGTFFSLGDTYTFNENWYGSLTVGSSTGGSFLPRFRADAFINRKLLPRKNLVATFGVGLYNAREVYRDRNLYLGATYYFAAPWIVEGGVRFNRSNPGSVGARSQFVAVTNGRDGQRYVTARYEFGNEAYQIVGGNAAISDFKSHITSLSLRQWIGRGQGISLVAERYSNPFYHRAGINAGYFREF